MNLWFQKESREFRLIAAAFVIAAIGLPVLAGCGSSSTKSAAQKPAKTVASREPETVAACIRSWNEQLPPVPSGRGALSPKVSAFFAVAEESHEAWVSIYEGKPITTKVGTFESTFSGPHCLVAIPAGEGAVWAYQNGEWSRQGEIGSPLYEYAVNPAYAEEAAIIKNFNLSLG